MMRRISSFSMTVALASLIVFVPGVGHSQTLLSWPDSRFDVGTYQSIESCLALERRISDSVAARSDTMFDTLPPPPGGVRPIARAVQSAVQRCMTNFPAATVPLQKFAIAQKLYLFTGDVSGAQVVVQRRLDAILAKDSVQRAAVLDSAIQTYALTLPGFLDPAGPLVEQYSKVRRTLNPYVQLRTYMDLLEMSRTLGRSELVQRYGEAYLTIAREVIDTVPGSGKWIMASRLRVQYVNRVLHEREWLDSLRKSNAAYAKIQGQYFASVWGGTADPKVLGITTGSPAPELRGDFVFPVASAKERLPRAGRLSFIMLVTGDQRDHMAYTQGVMVRRLKKQFPNLDVVLVTSTTGAVSPMAPPTPAEEAEVFRKMLLDFNKIPVTLVVSTRPFTRVADPDRRRINQPTVIEKTWSTLQRPGDAVLVDKTGVIVDAFHIYSREEQIAETIRVVYNRDNAGT